MIRKFTIAPARYRWIRLPPSHRPPVFCRGKLGLRIRLGMACMREAGALLRTQFGQLQMLLLLQAEGKFPHIVGAVDSCSAVWGRGVLQLSAACFTHLRTARLHVRMLPGEDVGDDSCQGAARAVLSRWVFTPRAAKDTVFPPVHLQGMLHLKSGQILNQSMGAERCQGIEAATQSTARHANTIQCLVAIRATLTILFTISCQVISEPLDFTRSSLRYSFGWFALHLCDHGARNENRNNSDKKIDENTAN